MPKVKRTLVKSGPELWAEVSDPEALATHLAAFGPIRITRTADAALVEWEGERAAGRLALTPSCFGTRVEIAAQATMSVLPAPPVPAPDPPPKPGFWARLLGRAPEPPPAPAAPEPLRIPAIAEDDVVAAMTATLDALGSARHRPFTR